GLGHGFLLEDAWDGCELGSPSRRVRGRDVEGHSGCRMKISRSSRSSLRDSSGRPAADATRAAIAKPKPYQSGPRAWVTRVKPRLPAANSAISSRAVLRSS